MYFLRWLYREVNPMILILGLVALYFLFNLATCSNSADSLVANTKTETTKSVAEESDATSKTEVVAKVDEANEETQEVIATNKKEMAITDAEGKPVESALSRVFKDKHVSNELNADVTDEAQQKASRPSILNRVFKKSKQTDDAEVAVEEVVEGTKKAAAVATGAAVATAGAVTAAVAADAEEVVEPEPKVEVVAEAKEAVAEVVTEQVEAAEVIATEEVVETEQQDADVAVVEDVEQENKKQGGFFGLFNRSDEDEQEPAEPAEQVDGDVAVVEEPATESAEVVTEAEVDLTTEDDTAEAEVTTAVSKEIEQVEEVNEEQAVEVAEAESTLSESQPASTATVPPPPSYSANVSSDQAALSAARRAYWDRDYATADTLYSEMISNEASNAELIAEYGNMLLQSGQVEKTLDAYEKAAGLMIDSGRKQEAKPLIDYISSWDQDRADALINKVFAQ